MIVSQIVAMSQNRAIGKGNRLPWNIPEDMQYFKNKTNGHCVVMGRKTFASMGSKPLPNRLNVVVTKKQDLQNTKVQVVHSIKEAMDFCRQQIQKKIWPEEVFICGGSEIYRQTSDITDRIYLTLIEQNYDGDTFFPEFDQEAFDLVSADPSRTVSKTQPPFVFLLYQRKTPRDS